MKLPRSTEPWWAIALIVALLFVLSLAWQFAGGVLSLCLILGLAKGVDLLVLHLGRRQTPARRVAYAYRAAPIEPERERYLSIVEDEDEVDEDRHP